MRQRVTKADLTEWTKTDRYTYTHKTGVRVIRDCNTRLWFVAGASANDGYGYSSLWAAVYAANRTPANWATN